MGGRAGCTDWRRIAGWSEVKTSAGDFDYESHGHGYARQRRADPRIAALVHQALGSARTVLNIGAGAGSYEPADRYVLAIEPSASMRAQRPAHLAPAVHGVAEKLPLDDQVGGCLDGFDHCPSVAGFAKGIE